MMEDADTNVGLKVTAMMGTRTAGIISKEEDLKVADIYLVFRHKNLIKLLMNRGIAL